MHECVPGFCEMSRFCNLRFYFIVKSAKNSDTFLSNLNIRKMSETKNVLYQSSKGYAHLWRKLERHIYPLYKLLDMLTSKKFRSLLTKTRFVLDKYDTKYEHRYYKNLAFVLSGIGLTVALCEASNLKKGIYSLYS